jgi:hypothetical protein
MTFNREILFAITQTLVTVALVGVTVFLAVTGKEVPELVSGLPFTAVGYFFGSQVEQRASAAAAKARQQ